MNRLVDQPPSLPAAATVLVADDSESTREILCGILESEGWTAIEAADGPAAIEQVHRHRPDLVLLDVTMPGKGGYQVCEDLRRLRAHDDMPIIFLSARSEARDRIEGLRRGAVDYVSKPFEPAEIVARVRNQLDLQRLGRRLRRANRALRRKQARIAADLRAAAAIQNALLPARPPAVPGLDVSWRFLPCEQVGGDLFQVHRLDDTHLAFYVVDVSGHGVPAAMLTVALSQTLAPGGAVLVDAGGRPRAPAEVLRLLNDEYPVERFERCFTIAYLLLDVRRGLLRYASAGHPPPLLVGAGGSIRPLAEGGTVIGLGDMLAVDEGRCALVPGDRVVVYTDGLAELSNPAGEMYGERRLRESLSKTCDVQVESACEIALAGARAFAAGRPFADDVTLLAVQIGNP